LKNALGNEQAEIDITAIRKQFGLRKILTGMRKCLKCERFFKSDDLKTNRICYSCNQIDSRSGNALL
jgi:hypothetical protein